MAWTAAVTDRHLSRTSRNVALREFASKLSMKQLMVVAYLGMANVQVPIWLRREPSHNLAACNLQVLGQLLCAVCNAQLGASAEIHRCVHLDNHTARSNSWLMHARWFCIYPSVTSASLALEIQPNMYLIIFRRVWEEGIWVGMTPGFSILGTCWRRLSNSTILLWLLFLRVRPLTLLPQTVPCKKRDLWSSCSRNLHSRGGSWSPWSSSYQV